MYQKLCMVGIFLQGFLFAGDGTLVPKCPGITARFKVTPGLTQEDLEIQKTDIEVLQDIVAQDGGLHKVYQDNPWNLINSLNTAEAVCFVQKQGIKFTRNDIEYAFTPEVEDAIRRILEIN